MKNNKSLKQRGLLALAVALVVAVAAVLVLNFISEDARLDVGPSGPKIPNIAPVETAVSTASSGASGSEMERLLGKARAYKMTACAGGCIDARKRSVKPGSANSLPALQKLIDNVSKNGGGTVYVPAGTYSLHGTLYLRKNVVLAGSGSATVLKQTKANSILVRLDDTSNVVLANMTIDQTAVKHVKGQSNHGVSITGAANAIVKGLTLKGPFSTDGEDRGDGIYIRKNADKGPEWTHHVVVLDIRIEGASRNGIALVGGENIWIEDVAMSDFNGKAVNAALDLEPETDRVVRKVTVDNLKVEGHRINLYTHGGTVADVLLRNMQLPDDSILLEGNVYDVTIEDSAAADLSIMRADTDNARPYSILVTGSVFRTTEGNQAVFLAGESVTFENCVFAGGKKAAVRDAGTTERITIRDSEVSDSEGAGILIYRPKAVELSGNTVYNNGLDGITLGNSNSEIKNASVTGTNRIYDNKRHGMMIDLPQGVIELSDADIYGNTENGLFLSNSQEAIIQRNRFNDNERGILLSAYESKRELKNVVIRDNTIHNTDGRQQYGIEIEDEGGVLEDITVVDNSILNSVKDDLRLPSGKNVEIFVKGNITK